MTLRSFCFTLLLLSTIHRSGHSQNYFEGKIIYKLDVKTKDPGLDPAKLKAYFGQEVTLVFKDGNCYYSFKDGPHDFWLYNKADNKSYLSKRGTDTIYWIDCSAGGNRIQKLRLTGIKETILGIDCNEMLIQYSEITTTRYFNSDSIPVNPAWFKNYKRDDEYLIDEKQKSIFLKSETEFEKFIVIETAVKISWEPVNEKIFKLPENAILVEEK